MFFEKIKRFGSFWGQRGAERKTDDGFSKLLTPSELFAHIWCCEGFCCDGREVDGKKILAALDELKPGWDK